MRDRFVNILDEVRSRHKFHILGYVAMPEHVHLLLSEPTQGNPSKILQVLKQKASRVPRRKPRRSVTGQLCLVFPERGADSGAFWERRFYDFNVWSGKKVKEKLEYMHANPVVRGLVKHPRDWPWSSWSHYAKGEEGLLRIDILGERKERESSLANARKIQRPHP
jgi:putative transposase